MPLDSYVLKDLQVASPQEALYPMEERGLQFGDGVYEVVRIYRGMYYLLEEHIDRFFLSAKAIGITPLFRKTELLNALFELLKQNNITEDSILYFQITRGSHPRDHAFPSQARPNFYAYTKKVPRRTYEMKNGVSALLSPDERWANCYIKSLNLLPNVLAKQEAVSQGHFEAILHRNHMITEGSSSNVFIVQNGCVYTHHTNRNILHGIVREKIKHFCSSASIPFFESAFSTECLWKADECFLTSSTCEVMPVTRIGYTPIATGKVGEITKILQQHYEKDARIDHNE
ncbi:D-amino-acid transaminase (plasmid) [Pontibacillus sp. ALD_SL1]|uniref:D-amino-acid transaminase n=1 Tax=Pontibacillus sp. ALD_SL1 TaxID=2777185 RepID=UPI001A96D2EB|nr:D-amino-acid transaminase [Pontibacillus sp. ALD_SL1]QST02375.1 D-amino-acid transaminase [Pontibacillus sp. ALD_SL1]